MAVPRDAAYVLSKAVLNRDVKAFAALLDPQALLHAESDEPRTIVNKSDAIAKYLQQCWSRHMVGDTQLLATAINEDQSTSFALLWQREVRPSADLADAAPSWASDARDVVSIWTVTWKDNLAQEIAHFATSPADVAYLKLKNQSQSEVNKPAAAKHCAVNFDPQQFACITTSNGDGIAEDDVQAALNAANHFCDIFDRADSSLVSSTLAEDFVEYIPNKNQVMKRRSSVEANLQIQGKYWESIWDGRHVAAADAASGFLHWVAVGKMKPSKPQDPTQIFTGAIFFLLNEDGLIRRAVHLNTTTAKDGDYRWALAGRRKIEAAAS